MGVTRIDQLADEERARFDEWADRWITIGLRTGPADRQRFEQAVEQCYRFAGIPWPGVVVWVPSPLVLALAAPAAALAIEAIIALSRAAKTPRGKIKTRSIVRDAVDGAVRGAVDGAVGGAVGDAVDGAVRGAVDDAVRGAVDGAVDGVIRQAWGNYFGGQLWAGGYWWGGAWTSFFREVCRLELTGDLWDRGRSYEATIESACWWWPHRRFVMVCERPLAIHRELVNPARPRGWNSHRLHCETGPAVVWPDGWGVHAWHGVRVPAAAIEHPETITAVQIRDEPNQEVRRVLLTRMGEDRFIQEGGARELHRDESGVLYDLGEQTLAVRVLNSTLESDQSRKPYWLYCHPELRPMRRSESGTVELGSPQTMTARNAVASTFGLRGTEYTPAFES